MISQWIIGAPAFSDICFSTILLLHMMQLAVGSIAWRRLKTRDISFVTSVVKRGEPTSIQWQSPMILKLYQYHILFHFWWSQDSISISCICIEFTTANRIDTHTHTHTCDTHKHAWFFQVGCAWLVSTSLAHFHRACRLWFWVWIPRACARASTGTSSCGQRSITGL